MAKSVVSIVRTGSSPSQEQVAEAVRRAVELAGGLPIQGGQTVLVKPNLVALSQWPGATTSPLVCRAVADLVREQGARAIIAESSAVGVDTEKVIHATGYQELRDRGYQVIDLKKTPAVKREVPKGRVLRQVSVFELALRADAIISVPVMKTHDQLEVTLSLKNLKGLEPDRDKRHMHRVGIVDGVVDVATLLRPAFAVVDGTIGQEGLGPVFGMPVEMGLVVAGRDLVAVDTVCAQIMGFQPQEIEVGKKAQERGLGTCHPQNIRVAGESIEAVGRRFVRCFEDRRTLVEGLRILHAEGTCTGCRNTVGSVVNDMKNSGTAHHLQGLTIITGADVAVPQDAPPGSVVTVGACVPRAQRGERHVRGCPPNNIWVVQEIVGHRVERPYATERGAG